MMRKTFSFPKSFAVIWGQGMCWGRHWRSDGVILSTYAQLFLFSGPSEVILKNKGKTDGVGKNHSLKRNPGTEIPYFGGI